MDNAETKVWWKSRGVVGPIVAMVAAALHQVGIDWGAEQTDLIVDGVLVLLEFVGALTGIVGRWRASTQITLTEQHPDGVGP